MPLGMYILWIMPLGTYILWNMPLGPYILLNMPPRYINFMEVAFRHIYFIEYAPRSVHFSRFQVEQIDAETIFPSSAVETFPQRSATTNSSESSESVHSAGSGRGE